MNIYALCLYEDNRIHHACVALPKGDYGDMPIVDTLPDGNPPDYLYVNGEYIYDPIPEVEPSNVPVAPRNIVAGEYVTIGGVLYKALSNIPNGCPVIEGQNAVVTTVEEQLYELTKGE